MFRESFATTLEKNTNTVSSSTRSVSCRILSLRGTYMDDKKIEQTINYLKLNNNIPVLDLTFTSSISTKNLTSLIAEVSSLKEIEALRPSFRSSLNKNDKDLPELCDAIEKNTTLTLLSLPPYCAEDVAALAKSCKKNNYLTYISLSICIDHEEKDSAQKQALAASGIAELIKNNSNLEGVSVHVTSHKMNDITIQLIADALSHNTKLKKLSLFDMGKISDKTISTLVSAIEKRGTPIKLGLYYKPILSKEAEKILETSTNIIEYDLDQPNPALAARAKLNQERHEVKKESSLQDQMQSSLAIRHGKT